MAIARQPAGLIGLAAAVVGLAGCGGEPRKNPVADWKATAAEACKDLARTLDDARRMGVIGNVDANVAAATNDVTALERAVRGAPEPVLRDVAAQADAVRGLAKAVEERDAKAVRSHAEAVGPAVDRASAALEGAGARCNAKAPRNLVAELGGSFWDSHIRDVWLTTSEELPSGTVDADDLERAAAALDRALRRAREVPAPRPARRAARAFLRAMAEYRDHARLAAQAMRSGAGDAAMEVHFRRLNRDSRRLTDAYTDVSTVLA